VVELLSGLPAEGRIEALSQVQRLVLDRIVQERVVGERIVPARDEGVGRST
jgi:hypothetical protein